MRKGQVVKFKSISDFTGETLQLEGTIIGGAKEIKKIQPEECGGMDNDEKVFLVERKDNFGNTHRHIVYPEEISKTKKAKKEDQHSDECDCIECLARTGKGGLDYDPSSDDEEFEEHERQVMRDTGIDKEAK